MDIIDEILTRGVENIIPGKDALEKLLRSGIKLNIYNGVDPTATKIHIGHAVPLRKLQQLLELGHHVTFLIGDLTAFIGDTSDKNTERPQLTEEEIQDNWQTYQRQAGKFLDFSKIPVVRNTEWLNKLNFTEVIKLTRHYSLNDFISRELIKTRLQSKGSVSLSEVLYPIAQGYDSWHLKTDLQIGGPEQIFNMQAGRTLIKDFDNRESFCLSNAILEGTDGRKMSKSWGNAIWLDDKPNDMFGKVMSLQDDLIIQYFTLATSLPLDEIAEIKKELDSGKNPMLAKKTLAHQIVKELHSEEDAEGAEIAWDNTYSKKIFPTENAILVSGTTISEAIQNSGQSASETKRFINAGAVDLNGEKITDRNRKLESGDEIKVGDKIFIKRK